MDGVFASQHRGPRHLRQMHTAPEILDGLRNFLPNPSSAHVSGSLMLICLDCALRGPVLLQIQCGWIYKQRKWNTLHKHLLIVSKYYFLAFPPTPPPIIFRNKTIQALLFGRTTASLVQSRSGKLGPLWWTNNDPPSCVNSSPGLALSRTFLCSPKTWPHERVILWRRGDGTKSLAYSAAGLVWRKV